MTRVDAPHPQIVELDGPEPPRPRRTSLRRAPGVALVVGVAVVLAVIAGLHPRPVAGRGGAAPGSALPSAGECLRWDVDPASPLQPAPGTLVRVACTLEHQGQVLASWRPGATDPAALRRRCPGSTATSVSIGRRAPAPEWTAPTVRRSATPVASGSTALDFVACVSILRWESGAFSLLGLDRPLGDDPADASRGLSAAAAVTWCLDDQRRTTACHQRHPIERVGVFAPPTVGALPATSCLDRARAVVGSRGSVAAAPGAGVLTASVGTTTEETLGGSADVTFLLCDVIAPAGRSLVGSVVGLGSRPLPLR